MRRWATGAVRESDEGKPRYDLIPALAMRRVAHRFAEGAEKYGESNWQKGIPRRQILASALRHIEAWRCCHEETGEIGVDVTRETGEDHLAAAVWGLLVLMQYEETNTNVNDVQEST